MAGSSSMSFSKNSDFNGMPSFLRRMPPFPYCDIHDSHRWIHIAQQLWIKIDVHQRLVVLNVSAIKSQNNLPIPHFLPSMILIFFFFNNAISNKKNSGETQKNYLMKYTMNLDDDYISWSLSEVFSPSWITWCYKLKCIGCIHHVITAWAKPKIQEDKLGC